MDERKSWLRENWRIGLILVLILGLALFLRVYFVYNEFAPAGYWTGGGDYSGGSDPFYWERALLYSFTTGKEIARDYAMNYPIGFPDVRPPMFDWFNLLSGYVISPAFGGNSWFAMVWMLNMNAAIFGVLAIIPTYLIGKEAFNRRAGILAALLLAISAASLQRSHATIAVHDSWTLFFVICAFYFYLRSLKTLNRRRWVENWFQPKMVSGGLRAFLKENRKSVLYAFMAGLSIAVTALSWQGWAYVPVILVLIFLVEVLLDRIRNQDAMGVTLLFMIILAVPLLVSFPWYLVRGQIKTWWDVPFYLFLVASALGLVFTVTRDYPWTLVIPATFAAGGAGLLVGFTVNPSLLFAFYSGAGYFVKNKVYQTIAEAQEPGMSELILNYGWFTFYVGLFAIAYMIWQMPRRNNPAYTMLVMWTAGALFMALAAARFLFNAAAVMAIATGYALDLVLDWGGFGQLKRTYHSLAEGSWRNAIRKSVKPRHVIVVLLIALLVFLPNVWFAVDAGIPYEQKGVYDKQIQGLLPSFLQAPGFSTVGAGSTFYLGAFGYSLPNESQYFPAAYQWLSTQDTNLPLVDRPAVMAWWDYGFEIAERGGHPVVADPFQNGYAISGQFILSQNETAAISLLALRIIEGNYQRNGGQLSPAVSQLLTGAGISPAVVLFAFRNPGSLIPIILGNPNLYGPWDSNMQFLNAPYIYLSQIFLARLTEDQLVNLYQALCTATNTSIGYFMADTRLFPISATNTGIFYAPAKLSDHRTVTLYNGQVLPVDFFQILANTNSAQNIPIQLVQPTDQVSSTTIQYQPMFYNSMFYRAFVGYSPSAVGSTDKGIPGLDQALASYLPEPAWNLTHFRVVYRTAYYNPYTDASNHTGAWRAINYDQAAALQAQISAGTATGVVDMSTLTDIQNGMVILRYYPGAYVNGTVTVGGLPLANVHITVTDELGTPHDVTSTDANGHYSVIVPFGNVTLTASVGTLDNRTLVGATTLATATFPVTEDQAMRVNQDLNGDGVPDWLITKDLAVAPRSIHGTVYLDTNYDSTFDEGDQVAPGAVVQVSAEALDQQATATAGPTGAYAIPDLTTGLYRVTVTYRGHTVGSSVIQVGTSTNALQDIAIPFSLVHGVTVDAGGAALGNATVLLTDRANGTTLDYVTNSTGVYGFGPLLAGNYTMKAVSGSLSSIPMDFTLGATGLTTNLTLVPSGGVAGTTLLFGTTLPFATLYFQEASTDYVIATATSDASGRYGLSLPAGDWNLNGRLYQGLGLYAPLGPVTVRPGQTTAYNGNFVDGGRVTGTVSATGQTGDLRAHIGFLSSAGDWWIRSALGNMYLAYLPTGTYSQVASVSGAMYTGSLGVTPSTSQDLILTNGTSLSGDVYWDQNANGRVDTGEGIAGARIALTDTTGQLDVAVADSTGAFTITLYSNRTYTGTVTADGFAPRAVGPATAAEIGPGVAWNLTPLPVSVSGTVFLNGTPILNRALGLHAVAEGGGAVSVDGATYSDGSYSLSLTPGTYRIVVDENATLGSDAWRYQNRALDTLVLSVAEGSATHDLTLVARALVTGNVTLGSTPVGAAVQFQGLDDTTLTTTAQGFSTYLQAGTYAVSANRTAGGAHYEVLQSVALPVSGNLSLALGNATQVTGLVTYQGLTLTTPMQLTFTRQEGGTFSGMSTTAGDFTAYLVPGNYTVSLDNTSSATVSGATLYFRYAFQGNLTVPPGTSSLVYTVMTSRSLDNTTVTGTVYLNGAGADASLSFIAESGGALNATTTAAMDGTYSVSLAPGAYVLYATRTVGSAAFLGRVNVPHAASFGNPIVLDSAFQLSGVTLDPAGVPVTAGLNVTGAATLSLTTGSNGAYQVLLPEGTYTLTADRSQTEQGMVVSYQGTATFTLASDTVVNLQLGRVEQHSVTLTWDATENRTVPAGGAVTYTITVANTGNLQDTFALSGSTAGWTFAFSPATITLNYGAAPHSVPVTVTIQSPANALVAHPPVTITATSTADNTAQGSVVVDVGIVRTRGLTAQGDPLSGTFDGPYLHYTVNVRNTRNAPAPADVSVPHTRDIVAPGWKARLGAAGSGPLSGLTLTNLTVPANSTASARLVLRSAGAHGGTTVVLNAAAVDTPSVSAQTVYTATLPALTVPAGASVSGSGVSLFVPPNVLLFAAIGGAGAAPISAPYLTPRGR